MFVLVRAHQVDKGLLNGCVWVYIRGDHLSGDPGKHGHVTELCKSLEVSGENLVGGNCILLTSS